MLERTAKREDSEEIEEKEDNSWKNIFLEITKGKISAH